MSLRRRLSVPAALAVAAGLFLTPLAAAPPAAAATESVTLAGSLQDELGCPADWQPECTATDLTQVDGTTYSAVFDVPAGSWNFKMALNHSWTESYPANDVPLVLEGPARVEFSYDDESHRIGITPQDLAGGVTASDRQYAGDSLRTGLTRERFYFLMADRFANGDSGNDTGGLTGGPLQTGLDPTDKGYYHGGDLRGLIQRLDYIKGLGTTAIWLTPSFKNRPVQGSGDDVTAGYHGYWITDFTQIDPHLGTNDELKELIDKAHAQGMKVFFDIVTNHTADVVSYAEGDYDYVSKETSPYTDLNGAAFDDADYAGTDDFPEMDETGFPYTPVVAPEDADLKHPDWLNDPLNYHNRGNSTFAGESSTYGDFSGLDDLFTEKPEVVDGMEDIYRAWVEFGVDGFRIDTVKHVNMEFWQSFGPAMQDAADDVGNPDFFMFGEVFDGSPAFQSQYSTTGQLPATLDFGFQGRAVEWVKGKAGTGLRDLFADDDYYTDLDSNAYSLPTFLGNHDMGRAAWMLGGRSEDETVRADVLRKVELSNALMFLTRGQPITYYGDEQGFIGRGGDKDARQDMFASQTAEYNDDPMLTGARGSHARFDASAPLYQHIKALAALRAAHPALADGAQVHRYASNDPGIFAFSRIAKGSRTEYVVALNNATEERSARFATYGHDQRFQPLYGAASEVRSDGQGRLRVTVPPQSAAVWKARSPMDRPRSAPAVYLTSPSAGAVVGGRAEIAAGLPEDGLTQVSFLYRPVGTTAWHRLGTDDNAPYRVFHDVSAMPKGTLLEYRAVAKDTVGHVGATSSYGIVGDAAGPGDGGGGVGPVVQPANVSVPGTHNSEMGCAGDWDPACDQAQLALDPDDQIWKGEYTLPPAGYAYKAAIDKAWDENYGAGGVANGANIEYTAPATPVDFYYDHATHWVTSDAQSTIVTAPGSFQSELGCPADWSPDCMQPWLQDPDGDGTFVWRSDRIPAGAYEFKVAEGLSWDVNYGDGGVPNGANLTLDVASDGLVVTITYVRSTHAISATVSRAGAAPDLAKQKAVWVSRDLVAVPASMVPAGSEPALLRWRLHWSPDGGLAVDAEDVTGGDVARLTRVAAGLPESVVAAHPELDGYVALRLPNGLRDDVPEILRGQVAVGLYDSTNRLLDATGVQIAGVLDDVYAGAAAERTYGVSFAGGSSGRASYRLWAPTAHDVELLTWPAASPADAPVSAATRTPMVRHGDGSWTATAGGRDARYLYDVTVWAPSTRHVETNLVTDPYSVALTPDSTRSVAVDLDDRAYQPALWRTTPSPRLARAVDSTVYELHVRDFSIGDASVPEAHRGSYLAFADDGDGTQHLRALAEAGLNTVHLLPSFDIASIGEDKSEQETPASADCGDLASYPPDGEQQQECIEEIRSADGFNWGYDPLHYSTPDGSYASSTAAADGGARVAEFRTMVGGLHRSGLRVVLDQVFNHTAAAGQDAKSVLDRVVPGYYHRLDPSGAVYTSTCCQNVATEHAMAEKLMVDSVVTWARGYQVDGFRFDLMGHHSRANMLAVRAALDRLTLKRDGVDGRSVYVYGEGWNFGEVADDALFEQARQGNLGGTGIGTFSDRLRDAVRGGGPFDDDPRKQGFGSGEATDSNGVTFPDYDPVASLAHDTDLVQLGLAANLRSFTFRTSDGSIKRGDQVDYNGQPAGYADEPDEVVTYVDAHDNETLWDALTFKLPVATSMDDRIRMNTLSLATAALAQTPSFWHAGADLLRSKSLDRNSYDSGDWFNTLSWTGADNGFGHGLPRKADNEAKWTYMQPLLGNAALKPSAAQVQQAAAMAQDLLRLRFSTPLFRLGSAEAINAKLTFPASGTPSAVPGVIAMRIDDTSGAGADPALDGVLVVFNASPSPVSQVVPGLTGASLSLSPIQTSGSDPVVKTSTWDASTGTATVPARTVAVFVQE